MTELTTRSDGFLGNCNGRAMVPFVFYNAGRLEMFSHCEAVPLGLGLGSEIVVSIVQVKDMSENNLNQRVIYIRCRLIVLV